MYSEIYCQGLAYMFVGAGSASPHPQGRPAGGRLPGGSCEPQAVSPSEQPHAAFQTLKLIKQGQPRLSEIVSIV